MAQEVAATQMAIKIMSKRKEPALSYLVTTVGMQSMLVFSIFIIYILLLFQESGDLSLCSLLDRVYIPNPLLCSILEENYGMLGPRTEVITCSSSPR